MSGRWFAVGVTGRVEEGLVLGGFEVEGGAVMIFLHWDGQEYLLFGCGFHF